MLRKTLVFLAIGIAARGLLAARSKNPAPAALAGQVSSDAEGFMEGVLVRAKGVGSTISVTVVSDREGRYTFPTNKLGPGRYNLDIRAVGYDLANPESAEVTAGETARADLRLVRARDLISQLTSAEWLLSVPGTERRKNQLYRCAACHSLTPIVQSTYNADSWLTTLARMAHWSVDSVISSPVPLPFKVTSKPDPDFASYLSTINLNSTGKWDYKLETLPRPAGRATRVIITEYDLPGARCLPHDAILDDKGMVWYNDFQQPLIGRLDPRTGETKEWRFPPLKPGFPTGTLTIQFDRHGYLWFPRARQGGITRFDPRTEKFQTWPAPPEYNNDHFAASQGATAADGTVWFVSGALRLIFRLDPKADRITTYQAFPGYHPEQRSPGADLQFNMSEKPEGHDIYGVATDSKSNAYFCDMEGGNIGRVDAKTGKVTLFKTPTLNSGPRRMSLDAAGHVWFGEYYANKLGMFDPKTEQFKEWTPPTPWTGPYPAMADKNGEVWTAGMGTDLIVRLDPQTGKSTEYLLPTVDANIRWIQVDNSTTPITVWVAEVHQGKIAKVEPID